MTVRTRIAPSPTGDPHVGTAYMALFNWVFARSQGGEFILRIEDTDVARSTPESEQMILDSLQWLSIDWDEGPDVGGPHGPYRQSARKHIYQEHAQTLIDGGHAFHCFCSAERLDEMRNAQRAAGENPRYDGHCLDLSAEEVQTRLGAGEPHVIRMRVPDQGTCTFEDALRGEIEIPYAQVDMQVLVKADGFPTYHLAVVVDDHLMGITHILRGEEWINSVPKHLLLYQYFGWDAPVLCHLPLLRNPDKSKLSKRKHPTSVNYYRQIGILPEALTNYLGMMGWSMPDEREIFSPQEMADDFQLDRIHLGGPVFDMEKLSWLNGQYLRGLDPDAFMDQIQSWALNRDNLAKLVPLLQERTEKLSDLVGQVDYLLGERVPLTTGHFEAGKADLETQVLILDHVSREFDALRDWQRDELFQICQNLAGHLEIKIRDFLFPLFMAISGRTVSLPLFDSMIFLGPDITRIRIREALGVLGVSKKQAKRLERAYRDYQAGQARLTGQMELEFYGAAGYVTGSCHILRIGGRTVLLDCGMIQGGDREEAKNADPFPFDARSIDAVILSHAHIDHSGRLPLLVKRGFRGTIHAQNATLALIRILLADCAGLEDSRVRRKNRRRDERNQPLLEPLYTQEDVGATLSLVQGQAMVRAWRWPRA